MKTKIVTNASFKAIIRYDGQMVAGIAAMPDGAARLFLLQGLESQESMVGRVSQWIKAQGGAGLEMQPPDILPEGIEVGEILMRLKSALGIPRQAEEASEYEIENAALVWSTDNDPTKDGRN